MKRVVLAWIACAACGGRLLDEGAVADAGASSDAGPLEAAASDVISADVDASISGTNISGEGSGVDTEPQLAVAADGTIAIVWQTTVQGTSTIRCAFSSNGASFGSPLDVAPGSDPAIAADAGGGFVVAFTANGVVSVAFAANGALAFGAAAAIGAGAHASVLVTTKGTRLVAFDGGVARAQGDVWSTAPLPGERLAMCESSLGIVTTYLGAAFVGTRASTDDGVTWPVSSQASLASDAIARLAPTCVATGIHTWVTYATTTVPPGATLPVADHVFVAHSADGAAAFDTARIEITEGTTTLATIPRAAIDDSGSVHVAYIGGDGANDPAGSVRAAKSSLWSASPSTVVASPELFDLSLMSATRLGDSLGIASRASTVYIAYPDNTAGTTHVSFRAM